MLSGPTLLRVVLTLVAAALLAALWQGLLPLTRREPAAAGKSAASEPAPPPSSSPAPSPAPGLVPVRVPPRALPQTPAPGPPPAFTALAQPSTPQAPAQPPTLPAAALPSVPPPSAPTANTPAALANVSPGSATSPRDEAPVAADDRAAPGNPLDLNTAGVQELNRLRGGGLIGRSIVRGRPYATVDELLTKRVLSRSAYERIRDQVTVR